MMLTHVSDSSLKGALSLTSYGIFFDELKEFSIWIIMSDDRIRDAFQSASSTQVARIDNEWLWLRYL